MHSFKLQTLIKNRLFSFRQTGRYVKRVQDRHSLIIITNIDRNFQLCYKRRREKTWDILKKKNKAFVFSTWTEFLALIFCKKWIFILMFYTMALHKIYKNAACTFYIHMFGINIWNEVENFPYPTICFNPLSNLIFSLYDNIIGLSQINKKHLILF